MKTDILYLGDGCSWQIYYGARLDGRPSFVHVVDFPTSGGYPFGLVQLNGCLYEHQGRGFFSPKNALPEEVGALYDCWARSYDRQLPWTVDVGVKLGRLLFERGYETEDLILDVCSGTGNTIIGLIRSGFLPENITGLDISSEMLKCAKRKPELGSVNFIQADLSTYVPKNGFHAVTGSLGLEYIPEDKLDLVFRGLRDSLSYRGCLIITITPNDDSNIRLKQYLLEKTKVLEIVEKMFTSTNDITFPLEILIFEREELLV